MKTYIKANINGYDEYFVVVERQNILKRIRNFLFG